MADLKEAVQSFVHERSWEKYHNPKDLAESICIEAAELLQLFQWLKPKETEQIKEDSLKMQQIKEELSDVIVYCLSMTNIMNIDMTSAILDKLEQNRKKYPTSLYKGRAHLTP